MFRYRVPYCCYDRVQILYQFIFINKAFDEIFSLQNCSIFSKNNNDFHIRFSFHSFTYVLTIHNMDIMHTRYWQHCDIDQRENKRRYVWSGRGRIKFGRKVGITCSSERFTRHRFWKSTRTARRTVNMYRARQFVSNNIVSGWKRHCVIGSTVCFARCGQVAIFLFFAIALLEGSGVRARQS